jgi:MtN3 and saliva related transmembrane protein
VTFETEIVGFMAGTLTTLCWAPQALKLIRSRDGRSISLIAQATFVTGCVLWLVYGVLLGSVAIILFNVITIALNILIIVLKLRFDEGVERDAT